MEKKNFALIGAGGFIAVRHLRAIKDTGNELLAAFDPSDSVGIMDSYFPNTSFFVEYERFDRHIDKLRHSNNKIDYVSICTPNYLHDSHIRFALRQGADAICEKPLVLNPWNVDALAEVERETGKRLNTILQLRLHPTIAELKKKMDADTSGKIYDIDLTYITSRGNWYFTSWKANEEKSGGIATNIGIHFFDMLAWIFGEPTLSQVHIMEPKRAAGYLELKKARVRWYLSVDNKALPEEVSAKGQRTYRSITIEGKEFEFSEGFTDLHTLSYQEILKGNGFGLSDAKNSIEMAYHIRHAKPLGLTGNYHPFCLRPIEYHPFMKRPE
jgi:UDP-N-acetyl-2-amino-2-deoxyglucuronate dehydrogenase